MNKLPLIWYDWRLKLFDTRVLDGVEIRSYWKLRKPKVFPGLVCIPLGMRRDSKIDQINLIRELWRKSFALNRK